MNEMPKYTSEDVEKLKKQLKKERGRKMMDKMTEKEITSRKEEIKADLEKRVDPDLVEKIERESIDDRIKRGNKSEEELPIFKATERKELGLKEKRIKLEKLKEYLKDLEQGETPLTVKGIEDEEIEKIKAEIEKLEEELEKE